MKRLKRKELREKTCRKRGKREGKEGNIQSAGAIQIEGMAAEGMAGVMIAAASTGRGIPMIEEADTATGEAATGIGITTDREDLMTMTAILREGITATGIQGDSAIPAAHRTGHIAAGMTGITIPADSTEAREGIPMTEETAMATEEAIATAGIMTGLEDPSVMKGGLHAIVRMAPTDVLSVVREVGRGASAQPLSRMAMIPSWQRRRGRAQMLSGLRTLFIRSLKRTTTDSEGYQESQKAFLRPLLFIEIFWSADNPVFRYSGCFQQSVLWAEPENTEQIARMAV